MTSIRYVCWMMLFIPYYAAGVGVACLLAALGAPGWAIVLPAVAGLGLGIWRGPRA